MTIGTQLAIAIGDDMTHDSRIWINGPMKSELRPEFVSVETTDALAKYQDAAKKGIKRLAKQYGELYRKLHLADVIKAQESVSK